MRIALVTTYPPGTGSLNEYAYHFVRYLREKPEVSEVILLVDELPDGQSYSTGNDPGLAPLQIVPCWRFDALTNLPRVVSAIRTVRPDIVLFNIQFATFGHGKIPGAFGLMLPAFVKAMGIPVIALLHNIMETVDLKQAGFANNPLVEGIIRTFGYVITRMLLRADLVALTIPKYVEILERRYHVQNVLLAPHGAFEIIAPPTDTATAGPQQIMAFGKFGTYKRVEVLIEAFRLLVQRGEPALELVIAGTDSPNAVGYLESMRQRYADLPGLRFTGYVSEEEVPQVFASASVVVFPYTSTTGSSGVLHQAGSYGRAVVLPHLGDLAELIAEEGYTGEFFEPDDPYSLADALARLIDDPVRRRDMGMQNYLAACGLPISEVVDWYVLHAQTLLNESNESTLPQPHMGLR